MGNRICFVTLMLTIASSVLAADDKLRERIKDANGIRTDVWIYNDIGQAMQQARRENKPLFVTFRCVPCKDCAAFDADVANGNERVRDIAKEKFISVRQVEMKGVDLSLFQFDYDLNWAGMFINADGVVYARFGTQSAEGSDAYNSIDGLVNTMNRVLELHANYPKNLAELTGKRGPSKKVMTALDLPGLQNPEKLAGQTERGNCIHCHNIHDAEQLHARAAGEFTHDLLWRYPLPDNIGMKIDRISGIRIKSIVADSPAAKGGLQENEDVLRINGQRITSIADMQWVLHGLPNTETKITVDASRTGHRTLSLPEGWKKSDISWRGSLWSLTPKLGMWTPELTTDQRKEFGISDPDNAFQVRSINRDKEPGRAVWEAGVRTNDIIVAFEGKPLRMTPQQVNMEIKLRYEVGDELPLTILRDGKRQDVRIRLVE